MIQGSETSVYQSGMLRGSSCAQAIKKLRDTRFGDIVLFNARFDDCDILDLRVKTSVAAQDGVQVRDLLVGEFCVGHECIYDESVKQNAISRDQDEDSMRG
jgi:hypothetical protein